MIEFTVTLCNPVARKCHEKIYSATHIVHVDGSQMD